MYYKIKLKCIRGKEIILYSNKNKNARKTLSFLKLAPNDINHNNNNNINKIIYMK